MPPNNAVGPKNMTKKINKFHFVEAVKYFVKEFHPTFEYKIIFSFRFVSFALILKCISSDFMELAANSTDKSIVMAI